MRCGSSFGPFVETAWTNDCELLRSVAAAKLQAEKLQWWWCKQYRRPLKDPLLQEYTLEELQVEYFMWAIEKDPQEAYPQKDMSNVQFRTGDALIDDWEKKLAEGKDDEINWDADVDSDFLKRFKAYSKRVAQRHFPKLREQETAAAQPQPTTPEPEVDLSEVLKAMDGFSDSYGDL